MRSKEQRLKSCDEEIARVKKEMGILKKEYSFDYRLTEMFYLRHMINMRVKIEMDSI